jgi:HTH-type transcriptional regulator / antitoxin HigA
MTWPTVIRTEQQYERALAEVETLMLDEGSLSGDQVDMLQLLVVLANDYERKHVHFPAPDPVDAILYAIDERRLTERELHRLLGGARRARRILARLQDLAVEDIRDLHAAFAIPLSALCRPMHKTPQQLDPHAVWPPAGSTQ